MGRIVKFKVPDVIVADFETQGIKRRPEYPPKPVGISIIMPGERKSTYYGWGHPTGNNCTQKQGYDVVRKTWALAHNKKLPIVFQNGKFDVDVAETHCEVRRLDWSLYHDTMFMIFLTDPHAGTYSLKPAAERLLGMPPEEQDVVKEWVLAHKKDIEAKYGIKFTPSEWGAFICEAPGQLVGKYADGDTIRTKKLFNLLYPQLFAKGMLDAYDRERKLMPILLDNERAGMRVDRKGLEKDIPDFRQCLNTTDEWLRKRLKSPDLNVDSDKEMAAALKKSGVVTDFVQTPGGQDSVSKKNLTVDLFKDKKVFTAFGYRNRLSTCLKFFMEPWYDISASNGYINTTWNQVRQSRSGNEVGGTRTGRPSTSNPNFLNLSKDFYDKGDGYEHPKHLGVKALELPQVRNYILPDAGCVFLHRDYNQQELRLLAHWENGALLDAYREDPRMDVHQFVVDMVWEILGLKIERRQAKVLNFGLIYGMGLGKLADDMNTDYNTAKRMKDAQLKALPGLKQLQDDIKALSRSGSPIHTLFGREYYAEEPKVFNGRLVDFIYKLLNYLIQGSAADVTKEAMIRYDSMRREGRFLVSVYDEINISAPKGAYKREMGILREAMEGVPGVDIPMLTDGKYGPRWGDLTKFKD